MQPEATQPELQPFEMMQRIARGQTWLRLPNFQLQILLCPQSLRLSARRLELLKQLTRQSPQRRV
jgi:hypothetical protein